MSNTYPNTDAIKNAIAAAVSARKLEQEADRYAKATTEDSQTTAAQRWSSFDLGRTRPRTARVDRT